MVSPIRQSARMPTKKTTKKDAAALERASYRAETAWEFMLMFGTAEQKAAAHADMVVAKHAAGFSYIPGVA